MNASRPMQVLRSNWGRKPLEVDMSVRLVLLLAFLAQGMHKCRTRSPRPAA
jgi:hypothetical protein